ncbi:uncharacterized protein PAC_11893 [Phialocephala subalpina]|uniref:Uncharacterized protein n=1 Tax=Phialocephala subalpina TaxID=576137 RepID=A0A1L7XAI5_9HELO|nr:uncharacterized protein PAC_11893 [Phialocephala subalpina]
MQKLGIFLPSSLNTRWLIAQMFWKGCWDVSVIFEVSMLQFIAAEYSLADDTDVLKGVRLSRSDLKYFARTSNQTEKDVAGWLSSIITTAMQAVESRPETTEPNDYHENELRDASYSTKPERTKPKFQKTRMATTRPSGSGQIPIFEEEALVSSGKRMAASGLSGSGQIRVLEEEDERVGSEGRPPVLAVRVKFASLRRKSQIRVLEMESGGLAGNGWQPLGSMVRIKFVSLSRSDGQRGVSGDHWTW